MIWMMIGQYLRYLLPLFPLLAILAGLNLDLSWRNLAHFRWAKAISLVGLIWLIGYAFSLNLIQTASSYVTERYPLQYAIGKQTGEDFLKQYLPVYGALEYLNRTGDGTHKVLSIGNNFRLYTRSRIFSLIGQYDPEIRRVRAAATQTKDRNILFDRLLEGKFDYILLYQTGSPTELNSAEILNVEFLYGYTSVEFDQDSVTLFRIRAPKEVEQDTEIASRNLLANPGFEVIDENGTPNGWSIIGKPYLTQAGTYSGELALRANSSNTVFQKIPVSAGLYYWLEYWHRSKKDGEIAWLSIKWLNEADEIIGNSLWKVKPLETYAKSFLIAQAPLSAKYALMTLSVGSSGQVWFDNIRFIQMK